MKPQVRDLQDLECFLVFSKSPRLGFRWLGNEGLHLTRGRVFGESRSSRFPMTHYGVQEGVSGWETRSIALGTPWDRLEGRAEKFGEQWSHGTELKNTKATKQLERKNSNSPRCDPRAKNGSRWRSWALGRGRMRILGQTRTKNTHVYWQKLRVGGIQVPSVRPAEWLVPPWALADHERQLKPEIKTCERQIVAACGVVSLSGVSHSPCSLLMFLHYPPWSPSPLFSLMLRSPPQG